MPSLALNVKERTIVYVEIKKSRMSIEAVIGCLYCVLLRVCPDVRHPFEEVRHQTANLGHLLH